MKKLIITLILIICTIQIFAATYHFANSGNDVTGDGSEGNPYATTTKAISITPSAGDLFLFKRGDTFRGNLVWADVDATVNNRIIVGAYGTGAKPKLFGSTNGDIAMWTSMGGNLYHSTNVFSTHTHLGFYNTNATPVAMIEKATQGGLSTNWDFFWDDANDWVVVYNSNGSPETQADGIEITSIEDVSSALIYIIRSDYWTVQDIDMRYSNCTGYASISNYTNFINCELRYNYDQGFYLAGATGITVDGCYLYHTGWKASILNAQGETIWISECTSTTIKNTESVYAHNIHINVWSSDSTTIDNCYVRELDWYPPIGSGNSGVYFDGCTNSICKNSIAENTNNGFSINNERPDLNPVCSNITLHNNIAINCASTQFGVSNSIQEDIVNGIYFYNNVSYITINGAVSFYAGLLTKNVVFKNNISYITGTGCASVFSRSVYSTVYDYNCDYSTVALSGYMWNNVYYTGASARTDYLTASGQDIHSITSNPQFVTEGADFHLQPGSPAINAGTNVGLIYTGSAPDIGRYEYTYINRGLTSKYNGKVIKHNGKTVKY